MDSRGSSANIAETAAFMGDEKRILIFSDAGGTGRSYHADLYTLHLFSHKYFNSASLMPFLF
ncbi:strawberry notch C-terminal domain-containing protein [Nostoc sp. CHAB 5784]|nr:strawberry notch C-terminal domain-containing protein [Nostoc mirabile CHAB5784]